MTVTRSQMLRLAGLVVDVLNAAHEVENFAAALSTRLDDETHRRLRNMRFDADRLRSDLLQLANKIPAED